MQPFTRILCLLLALTVAETVHANRLHSLYSISLGRSDRIIFEFDHVTEYSIAQPTENVVHITFENVEPAAAFIPSEIPPHVSLITDITTRLDNGGRFVVSVKLSRPAEPAGTTLTDSPWRYALDLSPRMGGNEQAKPQYIPGDRPFRTKYSQVEPGNVDHSPETFVISRWTVSLLMLISFAVGAMSVFGTRIGMNLLGRHFRRALKEPESPVSPRDLLHLELERDIAKLKGTVDQEKAFTTEGMREVNDERQQLILQLLREGVPLSDVAAALSMTPDQIRQILESHP